ncbi:hypothetical protein [Metabacillus litoralis]|uniref:hypothetical protein n=1 Tax=Metabacillus litoralis TaxID=152268 RepID=UPI001CFE82F5|nr:hypothetical protein [Metabacillus litoralis]
MKPPFNTLTISDVEKLRKKRSCIPVGRSSIIYDHTMAEILSAQTHLKSLYKVRVTLPFTERILLLNNIY